jgi:tetratricopeptide (TPR) repeat protein
VIILRKIELVEFKGIDLDSNPEKSYKEAKYQLAEEKRNSLNRGDINGAGEASKGLSECYRRLGQRTLAEHERSTAHELFSETKNVDGIGWVQWLRANAKRQDGQYTEAIRILTKTIRQGTGVIPVKLIAYCLAGIAETTRIQGNYKISIPQHRKVLRLFEKLQDYRGVVWAYEGIAQMKKNMCRLKEAHSLFDQARQIASETGDIRGLGYAFKGLGEVRGMLGWQEPSVRDLMTALTIFTGSSSRIAEAYTRKTFGDCLVNFSNFEEATRQYQKASEIFRELEHLRGAGIGNLHATLGMKMKAWGFYSLADKIFKSQRLTYGIGLCRNGFLRIGIPAKEYGGIEASGLLPQHDINDILLDCTQIIKADYQWLLRVN